MAYRKTESSPGSSAGWPNFRHWTRSPRAASAGLAALLAFAATFSGADSHGQTPQPGAQSDEPSRAEPSRVAVSAQQDFGVSALTRWVKEQHGTLSAYAVAVGSSTPLFAANEDSALNPASTMKLVTAAAVLDVLGPDFVYQTGLYGIVTDNRCPRLVLRGQGDPSLGEADLWRLVNSLVNQGLREVGEVLVDQSAFDEQWTPPGFEQQPNEWAAFRAPISAIALEGNTLTLNVQPAAAGSPARAWIEPLGVAVLEGTVQSAARGGGEHIQLEMVPGTPLKARIGGTVSEGLGRLRFSKRLDDPRLAAGLNLKALLEQRGVKVGQVALGGADVSQRLTYTSSASLAELVKSLGKTSDNFYAETLFKSLARSADAAPASSQAAAARVMAWLEQVGPLPAGTRVRNGSGLFDSNRLAASTLTRVLALAVTRPRLGPEFITQLAIGGVDGTLRSRFPRLREKRSIRAKTGTLDDVIALAGYVLRDGKSPIAFALLVNGMKGQHGELRAKLDDVVSELANGS